MKFGIIGNGFVGQATKILKSSNTEMLVYDIDPEKCEPKGLQLSDMKECSVIFISVPTPMNKDGRNYLGIVESVIKKLREHIDENATHLIIRSTVLPGTTDKLGCYFMPEFLTEKNWDYDFRNCENWFFGLRDGDNENFKNAIKDIFTSAFECGNIKYNNLTFVKNKEAEMIKYFRNVFLSIKVSFCNEIYDLCENKEIDYDVVRRYASIDKRIGESHTRVPGHDGKRGFGGTCFPKDTTALLREFEDSNIKSYIIEAATKRNTEKDRPEKDWELDKGRAVVN